MIDASMSPEERLGDWKDFRKSLTDELSKEEILQKVAEYWISVPIVRYYLDFDHPETWPTPWELIYSGEFCSTGIAYLMMKTLELAPADKCRNSEIKLCWIKDLQIEDLVMVLVVDSRHVLNYMHGRISDWQELQNHCQIICEYSGFKLLSD